jgi:hypothetical protein
MALLPWLRRRKVEPSAEVVALRLAVAAQLELVVAGKTSAEDALAAIEPLPAHTDRLASDAWHLLFHFRDDEDIHAREPAYREEQLRGLAHWVKRLRAER